MRVLEIVNGRLEIGERERPLAKGHHLIIEIASAGVNRADILQRDGKYPPPLGASDIPGLEVAGTVVQLGPNANKFKLGQEVCALLQGGGFAEFCSVHEDLALAIPKGISLEMAGSIPETYFTVWDNVFRRANLFKGESLLVHGGTSGIGTTAIQLAKAFGATVIATSGSDLKVEACRSLGSDLSINYRTQDFVSELAKFTGGKGVDVILDMIGGDYFNRNIECLAMEGRLAQIGLQHGSKVDLLLHKVMQKRLSIMGSTLRARNVEDKRPIAQDLLKYVWPLFKAGEIKTIVQVQFPFDEANQALEIMENGALIGKLLLRP